MNADAISHWLLGAAAAGGAGWLLGALALATFLSDDLACLAGGVLVGLQQVDFLPAAIACWGGILTGDLLLVAAGRHFGRAALQRRPLRGRVSPDAIARGEQWFARHGRFALLASRFLPGTRLPLSLAAGVLRVPAATVVVIFSASALVWAPLLVGLGAWAGQGTTEASTTAGRIGVTLASGIGLVWGLPRAGAALGSWRRRRRLLARWRRLTRWEYWPAWAVYPPVVLATLWYGLRYRGWLVCTAANPGIEAAGGLCGESKSAILRQLAGAGPRVATWTLLAPGTLEQRAAAVTAFQSGLAEPWPLVLKPDVGERGSGVVIARSPDELAAKLRTDPRPLIAQAYVPGVEFGVFYLRYPDQPGLVFAVTEKRTVSVRGDGRSPLEDLILADDRAVAMAGYFLTTFAHRRAEVPPAGETVMLAELGTHCRGALFLDGNHHQTPELSAAVDAISRTFPGFHYGRYDVRSPSAAAFRRGEFTVIELNGLSSEATHIYDPAHSVWFGWRTLLRQWRHAYAIGAANRARGARVWSLAEVRRLVFPRS